VLVNIAQTQKNTVFLTLALMNKSVEFVLKDKGKLFLFLFFMFVLLFM
jgi:hypothetical protein